MKKWDSKRGNSTIAADTIKGAIKEVKDELRAGNPQEREKNVKFNLNAFAEELINELPIIRLDGQLHTYFNGVYKRGSRYIKNACIRKKPDITERQRAEVIGYAEARILEDSKRSLPQFLNFKNGIYNILTGDFKDLSPEYITVNQIPHDYKPEAKSEFLNDFLNNIACGDSSLVSVLEEMMGTCFYPSNNIAKQRVLFMLTGGKNNGKSSFFLALQTMLGEKNYSTVELQKLQDRFNTASVYNKLANIGDDIESTRLVDTGIIKKLASGEKLQAEYKGKDPFDFASYAKLFFSMNNPPSKKDETGAVERRMLFVPFLADFTGKEDLEMREKLQAEEVQEALVVKAINGLQRVFNNKGFTQCQRTKEAEHEALLETDSIYAFLCNYHPVYSSLDGKNSLHVYDLYESYCREEGKASNSKPYFYKRIKTFTGADRKQVRNKDGVGSSRVFYFPREGGREGRYEQRNFVA